MNCRSAVLAPIALALPLAYASTATAHTTVVTCIVKGVATFPERIHIQCAPPNPLDHEAVEDFGTLRFFAVATNVNPEQDAFVTRVLTLANTAIATHQGIQVFFDWWDKTGAAFGCQLADCRKIIAVQLLDH